MENNVVHIWRDQKPDDHFWAFYYYCKRQGDKVDVQNAKSGKKGLKDLRIIYKKFNQPS